MSLARTFLGMALIGLGLGHTCRPCVTLAAATPAQAQALEELRSALAGRRLEEIKPQLAQLAELQGDSAFQTEVARLELLAQYVLGFWEAVDKGARAALTAGELEVDDKRIAVVDYDRRLFVIRMEGQNRRYTIRDIPAKLALVLAQQHLKKDVANNRVYFGAFLAMDAKGDRRLARQQWDEAARGGVDVQMLLPELDTRRVAPPIELPELTPPMKTVLHPAQWLLRRKTGSRLVRDPLGKQGVQNSEGRLEVASVADEEAQVIHKQRLVADFRCVAFFHDLPQGRQFGLFGTNASDESVLVTLPEGDVKVEFKRVGGQFTCKVNELDVPVAPNPDSKRLAGNLGVELPADGKTTIAGFYVEGR